jgi:hypothetical protein
MRFFKRNSAKRNTMGVSAPAAMKIQFCRNEPDNLLKTKERPCGTPIIFGGTQQLIQNKERPLETPAKPHLRIFPVRYRSGYAFQ